MGRLFVDVGVFLLLLFKKKTLPAIAGEREEFQDNVVIGGETILARIKRQFVPQLFCLSGILFLL